MNNRNGGFQADMASLVTSLVMLFSFMLLPYISVSLGTTQGINISANMTGLQYFFLSESRNLTVTDTLISGIVAILPIFVVVLSGVALGNRSASRNIAFANMGIGIFEIFLLFFLLLRISSFIDGGLSVALATLSIGYWLMFLGAIVLILQVFVNRGGGLGRTPAMMDIPTSFNPPPHMPNVMPAPSPAAPMRPMGTPANAWLVNVQNQQSHQLMRGETRIGRSTQHNHIVINNPQVGRQQAIIREEGMHFVLYEAGSRQHVIVNGNPVQGRYVLNPNDQVTFGNVVLRFVRG